MSYIAVSGRRFYVIVVGDVVEVADTREVAIRRLHDLIQSSADVSENDVFLCEICVEQVCDGADCRRLLKIDHVRWPQVIIELARRTSFTPPRAGS